MTESANDRDRLLRSILGRAARDRRFRDRLLTDPREAIREHSGLEIPRGYRLRFIERDPGIDALVVLPDFRGGSGELPDGAMDEMVHGAGGVFFTYLDARSWPW